MTKGQVYSAETEGHCLECLDLLSESKGLVGHVEYVESNEWPGAVVEINLDSTTYMGTLAGSCPMSSQQGATQSPLLLSS